MSALPQTSTSHGFSSESFAAHLAQRGSAPSWWLEAKKAAWNQYLASPAPARNDERWRFSSIQGFDLGAYNVADAAIPQPPSLPEFSRCAEIIFANQKVLSRTALPQKWVDAGVIFCPLEEALALHGDRVRQYFQKHPALLGAEKFVALNTALTSTGAFLYVPKGVEVDEPFAVQHTLFGTDVSVFPHTIVVLEDRAKATVAEFLVSADQDSRQFVSGVNDLYAGNGALLTYVGAQNWTRNTLAVQTNSIVAQRDARVVSLNLHLGGKQARHESHSRLQGPGAHSEMLALTVASDEQEFDQRTLQTHQAPHTSSNLLYKNALLDKAKTIFSGLIIVEQDAQKTDAYQSNRNLMLSDQAEANSLPGLEIQANDVRCTHGATTARIDKEQEFYLESRGISEKQADELIVFGFFEEVLAKLDNETLHSALSGLIAKKLKR